MRLLPTIACRSAVVALSSPAAFAQSAADFFKGKQISFFIGYNPGGTYDIYSRLAAVQLSRARWLLDS